jgi:hypothetical protein
VRRKSALVAFAAACLVLLAMGCGNASYQSDPAPAAETRTVVVTTTVAQPASAAETTQAPERTEPAAKPFRSAQLTSAETTFWRLIGETRRAAGNDTGRQSELLKDRLTQLSPSAILAFWHTRRLLDRRAYTWSLWGAANVIEDGCSDDCFRDFRGYVISLGRDPYERALRNPDSLASVAADAETGDWENADDVAPDAYSSVTGNDFPLSDSDLSGRPSGKSLDLGSRAALARRYPRLAARFRN